MSGLRSEPGQEPAADRGSGRCLQGSHHAGPPALHTTTELSSVMRGTLAAVLQARNEVRGWRRRRNWRGGRAWGLVPLAPATTEEEEPGALSPECRRCRK